MKIVTAASNVRMFSETGDPMLNLTQNPDMLTAKTKKPAIALITYARSEYFEEVFDSILNQTINGRSFSDYFDLYIFQDGLLKNDTPANIKGHEAIKSICANKIAASNFIVQEENLCVALHFDYIERLFFEKQDREWAAFFEDDLVLSPGYLETLMCMAESFKDDERVAMFNCFGMSAKEPLEVQEKNKNSLACMDHHWGFGIYQSVWKKRQAFVDEYLKMIDHTPYRNRNHKRINNWLSFSGFKPRATSQDYIKACSISAMGMVKISSFANFGTYIGKTGLHFTSEIFASFGYDQNIIFPNPIRELFTLDDTTYQNILNYQQNQTILAPETFSQSDFKNKLLTDRLTPAVADASLDTINEMTEKDVIAGYKIFLGRLPESNQIIQGWIGRSTSDFLKVLISSKEFRSRRQFNPLILNVAKEILDAVKQN